MRARRNVVGLAAVMLVWALTPRPAAACWCGYGGTVGDISITEQLGDEACPVAWYPEVVREWATWMVRLDRALPAGMKLESFAGEAKVTLTRAGRTRPVATIEWGDDFAALFAAVARLSADRGREKLARQLKPEVYTVQLLASGSGEAAQRLADGVARAGAVRSGFFSTIEAPSDNVRTPHVVSETDARGRELHKVLYGAYLTREAASAAALALADTTGMQTFVRKL